MASKWFLVSVDPHKQNLPIEDKKTILTHACQPNGNDVEIVTLANGEKSLAVYVRGGAGDHKATRDLEKCLERIKMPADIDYRTLKDGDPNKLLATGEWERISS